MIQLLNQYDHELMLWLNYDGGTLLDAFWFAVSYKFSWIPLYAAILYVFWRLAKSQSLDSRSFWLRLGCLIVTTALVILAADQLSSGLIKPLVERPRPSHEPGLMEQLHYVNDYRGGRYGFVSSHAANTLALVVWVCLLFRQHALWAAMATFYFLNCYSRIYLGVHYPGDILCGSVIGALCGWLGYWGYTRCTQRLNAQPAATSVNQISTAPITMVFWASALIMLGYAAII